MAKQKKTAAGKLTKAPAKKAASKKKAAAKKTSVKPAKKTPAKKAAAPKKAAAKGKKRKPETLMCFLTTACVHYYGLPDDGYELNTLRAYRDNQLASSKGGKALIEEYYRISPVIVKHIGNDEKKSAVYKYIYSVVVSACQNIEQQNWNMARKIYTQMVQKLALRYNISR